MVSPEAKLSRRDLAAVAVVAQCDPRTVARSLAGIAGDPACDARIAAALVELGLAAPQPLAVATNPTDQA